MSQEAIATIESAGLGKPLDGTQQQHARDMLDSAGLEALVRLTPLPVAGGSMIQRVTPPPMAGALHMSLPALGGHFATGLKEGFVTKDFQRVADLAIQGSEISPGRLISETLMLQMKIGVADAFRSVSSKVSDGLNNIVVKQG